MSTRSGRRAARGWSSQRAFLAIPNAFSTSAVLSTQCPRYVFFLTLHTVIDTEYTQAFGLIVRRINDEPFDVPSVPGSRAVTIKFMIPNSRMGSVIGKQGSKIKEIQDASGARLNASEGMLPGSTEVRVYVFITAHQLTLNPAACAQRSWCRRRYPYRYVLHRQYPYRGAGAHAILIQFYLPPDFQLPPPYSWWFVLRPRLRFLSRLDTLQPTAATSDAADLHPERPCRLYHWEGGQ